MNNADVFAARLARIQAGGPNTKGTIFVGQDEQHYFGMKTVIRQSKRHEVAAQALYPLSQIGAFSLGLLAVGLGYFVRFHLMAGQAEVKDGDLEMALAGGIGIAVSLVLAQMFRLTSIGHKAMQSAGVFVMVCAFHNFAHWVPGPMSTLFSPEWVQRVQTEALPNSARFRGAYFPLFDKGSAATDAMAEPAAKNPVENTSGATVSTCAAAKSVVKLIEMDNAKGKKPAPTSTAPCMGG